MTIDHLQNKLQQLVTDYQHLQQDNQTLRQELSQIKADNEDLSQRYELAINKLESLLTRIQQWQDTHDQ